MSPDRGRAKKRTGHADKPRASLYLLSFFISQNYSRSRRPKSRTIVALHIKILLSLSLGCSVDRPLRKHRSFTRSRDNRARYSCCGERWIYLARKGGQSAGAREIEGYLVINAGIESIRRTGGYTQKSTYR